MSNNVVAFPKGKRNAPPQTVQEVFESVENVHKDHIELIIDESLSYLFGRVYEEGFDLSGPGCVKSSALLVEAFRAALYDSVGIDHPLQELSETMFTYHGDGGDVIMASDEEMGITFEDVEEFYNTEHINDLVSPPPIE